MPRLHTLLLMLLAFGLTACNGEANLTNARNALTGEDSDESGDEDYDDWGDDEDYDEDEDCDEDLDDEDWGDEDEFDEEALEEAFEVCEDELEAADACWDALDEDAADAAYEACEELEEALWDCVDETGLFDDYDDEDGDEDDEFGDEDDFEVPEECEDELEAADVCWDGLDEDTATDADIDACIELEDALIECAGWEDESVDDEPVGILPGE